MEDYRDALPSITAESTEIGNFAEESVILQSLGSF